MTKTDVGTNDSTCAIMIFKESSFAPCCKNRLILEIVDAYFCFIKKKLTNFVNT